VPAVVHSFNDKEEIMSKYAAKYESLVFGRRYEGWQVSDPSLADGIIVYALWGSLTDKDTSVVYDGGALRVIVRYTREHGGGCEREFWGETNLYDARRWLHDLFGLAVSLPTALDADIWQDAADL
jgi:hypothetical protein